MFSEEGPGTHPEGCVRLSPCNSRGLGRPSFQPRALHIPWFNKQPHMSASYFHTSGTRVRLRIYGFSPFQLYAKWQHAFSAWCLMCEEVRSTPLEC